MVLARIFQSGMVLQQGKTIPVWGTASPGSLIIVTIQGIKSQGRADAEGNFQVNLPPLHYSPEERLTVTDGDESLILEKVAVGEVWIAGGQSNMEFWMHYEKHLEETRPACDNSLIRFFETPKISFAGQEAYFDYSRQGIWRTADKEQIDYFSGVGYFFAEMLHRELRVPVGIIGCNYGGTAVQAWMPEADVQEAGKAWMEDFQRTFGGLNMAAYWERQRKSPGNNSGDPFSNEFNNRFLPCTPPLDEVFQYFAGLSQNASVDSAALADPSPTLLPGCLYENMLKTIAPFAARGFIWYQGESDEPHADMYGIMLTRMIHEWRELWDEKLPFLQVQLPGFRSWFGREQTGFNELRSQQKAVADAVPAVWMASISDAGEEMDIHPKDKKTPGKRLALLALGKVYGRNLLCEAPEPDTASFQNRTVTIHFRNAPDGLSLSGQGWMPIKADETDIVSTSIDGENLIIRLAEKPQGAVTIRFAQDPFYLVGLVNSAGIPAIPFVRKILISESP